MEWYRKTWSCILFLIVFPPLGVYWLWKYHMEWNKNLRVNITIVSAVWFFALLGIAAISSPKVEKITLLEDDIKIGIGEIAEINVVIEPKDARLSDLKARTSKEEVVTLRPKQNHMGAMSYELQAKQEGSTTIVVYCEDVQSNIITVCVLDRDKLAKQAKAVEQQIENIGAVSLRSGDSIITARRAYDALDEDAALLVENLGELVQAEKALQELQDKAWRQADEAKKRIEAIGEVSIESESAIVSAREYYDSLSAEVQPLVENYSQLEAAEQIFAQKKEAAQKEAEQNDVPPPKETKKGEGTRPIENGQSDSSGDKVYWTPNGKKYHTTRSCPTLSRSKVIRSGTISQAGGRDLCKVCG